MNESSPIELAQLVAVDSETHPIQDGLLAPPGVCGSFATAGGEGMMLFPAYLDELEAYLRSSTVIGGANLAFDFAVAAAEPEGGRWKGRPELLPLIFDKYERGEVFDVLIGIALDAIANGLLFKDPATGQAIRYPPTPDQLARGKMGKIAKRYSLEIATRLLLGRENAKINDEYRLRYHELENKPIAEWPPVAVQYPEDDARNTFDDAAVLICRGRNLGYMEGRTITHMTHQARAAWAMHLACVHGFRTDGPRVDALATKIERKYNEAREQFKDTGILRREGPKAGTKDTAALKRMVIKAYGGGAPCETCSGTGKVPSPKRPKNKINCKTCGGAGLALPESLPLTDKGGVSCARDTLAESGDDLLEQFSGVSETDKLRNTYIPFLRTGVTRPVNIRSNVLVESGRASYDGLIQLLPRAGGIRECIEAREDTLFCSVDFAALELCTLAQTCLRVVGYSRMAEAINAAKDPGILHTRLGARLIGVPIDEFARMVKAGEKRGADGRYNAKAANFGFPGLMGAAKLTISKRKEGIRFCITSSHAPPCPECAGCKCAGMDKHCDLTHCKRCYGRGFLCGLEKVTEWKRRPIAPTCVQCIEDAEEIRLSYYEEWPEVPEYFEWVKTHDGIEEGIAEIVSPGTGYIRGGLHASSLANHSFQHLASAGAKHALWLVSKECYTDRASPLWGTRPIVFAHDEIISEIPNGPTQTPAAWRQAEIMRTAMAEFCPDVFVGAEPALMRRWYKDAKIVKDADGNLLPWEPKAKAA